MANNLRIKAYSSGSTEVQSAGLELGEQLTFSSGYPGGLYLDCGFFVPRDITSTWPVQLGQRVKVQNGFVTVWEGYITGIENRATTDGQGAQVTAMGAWGYYLMRRKWRKWWADTRSGEEAWKWTPTIPDETFLNIDRTTPRITLVPKSIRNAAGAEVGWTNNQTLGIVYTSPTGETVKRITLDYDLQEGAQAWKGNVYNVTGAADLLSRTTSNATPGTRVSWDSGTIATPTQKLYIQLISQAGQTPPTDGTVYWDVANIVVYSETGAINGQEVAKDVRAHVVEFSADDTNIGALTYALVPFISNTDTLADILTNAANYGDASFNRWAAYCKSSDDSTDDKPLLALEQVPALTDYDYAVRMDEVNTADLAFMQDVTEVRNWITIEYTDATNNQIIVTPDDDANLKDTASIALYGEAHEWLSLQTTSLTNATNYARRFLAARKDPQWKASGNIPIVGSVRAKDGTPVPASQIVSGKRIKIENYLNDLSGNGLTFLITGTSYDDASEVCTLSVGQPDNMDILLARIIS